jgi:hypothetical protein
MLDHGVYTSVTEISEAESIGESYVSRILRLALLAPGIVEEILDGRAGHQLMRGQLEQPLPVSWEEQRRMLGHACPEPPACAKYLHARGGSRYCQA